VDPVQAGELRRWAERLGRSADRDKRVAARAIIMLLDELAHAEQPPPAPPRERGRTERKPDRRTQARTERATARRKRRRRGLLRLSLVLVLVGGVVYGTLAVGAVVAAPNLDALGPPQDARIGPVGLPTLGFSVDGELSSVRWTLDGADVTKLARLRNGRILFDGSRLRDGRHRLRASASGGFPGSSSTHTWRFSVDTRGPTIALDPPGGHIVSGNPLRLSGQLEPGAALTVDGRPVLVKNSRFGVTWQRRPAKPVLLVATDTLRNATTKRVEVLYVPRLPPVPTRAVHVTFYGWADRDLRRGIFELIDSGRINAVELDLKDESGIVGFGSRVPLARGVGAAQPIYDLRAAVKLLHSKGVRVIGRLVCFRDPLHAKAAWAAGRKNEVIQTPDGDLYAGDYGGFTNFADPVVRKYQIDVAVAAAKLGVDEILYDYVRRPDGPISSMVFPGLKGTPERSIVSFLAETRRALKPYGTFLGIAVFGVAATRPQEVAQDIPSMAEHVDYVSAMLYPSHWAPGEYGVENPITQPYDIVRRSLEDFQLKVRGTGARVLPWVQDFTLYGVEYGPREVAAQIRAAYDVGIDEWLLWDSAVTYTAEALATDARTAKFRRQVVRPLPLGPHANELGLVPVLMHHQIRTDGGGPYDLTPTEFRAELARLYRDDYFPVRAIDLVTGKLNVPAGKTPVVMTFDDSTKEQFSLLPDGTPKPETAIGIMLAFQRKHPDWKLAGTFYPNREPFAGAAEGPQMLRWLAEHGFELGDHTKDHLPLNTLDDTEVQRQLVLGQRVITSAVPGTRVRTMALPLGAYPNTHSLAIRGSWGGESYHFAGVFLAGAEPSASPYAQRFDQTAIPRIRTTHYSKWRGEHDFTAGYWLDLLEKEPGLRYVSDGNAKTITIPHELEGKLATRFRSRAKAY
jgi:peptidoglycan/xylan/chitin deacetylase (PgdA/CDA1 family)